MPPLILCILDGFGYAPAGLNNAITQAHTPALRELWANSYSLLSASEQAVGLPAGQVGNSEVGHLTIGSGRVVLQDLPRIDEAISSGALANNPVLQALPARSTYHLIGLISDGGVHGHIKHTIALASILKNKGHHVILHAIVDGRDCVPQSAMQYLAEITRHDIEVATISGRYYVMDRDQRWERTKIAYQAIVMGRGIQTSSASAAVEVSYQQQVTDEFMLPCVIGEYNGMQPQDVVICTNYRSDRIRQLLESMLLPDINQHIALPMPNITAIAMVPYSNKLDKVMSVLFPKEVVSKTLGETIATAGRRQLRIAETEKYAHVTYFLNGGKEDPWPNEERILIPSPKVATYDLSPAMSAHEVTEAFFAAQEKQPYSFVCINYANADMVGHTGNMAATVAAIEALDLELSRLIAFVKANGWHMLITADHGNAEQMYDVIHNQPYTAHTLNLVPCWYVGMNDIQLSNGTLADVAPTVLELMGIAVPSQMTGRSLIL